MSFLDDYALPGLGGATSGAAAGSAFGPIGTGVGAGAGLLMGLFSGGGQSKAHNAQRQGLDAAMKRLQEFSAQQYQGRMQDLDKTLSFYKPAEDYLKRIYGGGQTAGPGGQVASRAPTPAGPQGPQRPPGFPDLRPGTKSAFDALGIKGP